MPTSLPRLNPTAAAQITHAAAAALLVAALVHLGVVLYSEFYLPYNLDDATIAPSAQVQDNPDAKLILQTAHVLEQRRTTTAAVVSPDAFWAPSSTAPSAPEKR